MEGRRNVCDYEGVLQDLPTTRDMAPNDTQLLPVICKEFTSGLTQQEYKEGRGQEACSTAQDVAPRHSDLVPVSVAAAAVGSAAAAWPSAVWQRTGAHERIVGGHEASIADLPRQPAFELGGDQRCGASLIGPSWALTAGHCVEDVKLDYLALRAGSSVRGGGGSRLPAPAVNGSFTLGPNVQIVGLPADGYDPPSGLPGMVSGWGYQHSGSGPSSTLQVVDINVVDREICRQVFVAVNAVTGRMICSGEFSRGMCLGDSGGPLVNNGTQVGIVSWALASCQVGLSVQTNVGYLRSWIRDTAGI
ncbi:trypsin-7-like [Schistocerca cancellata]|uniref:trypsin-7-like n=1 Tax=Schistocerca cancellata TaxID=274614 RepID=UPI0021175A0A|nr:trypsin-7-like [Schistocerca cancellata]